MKSNTLGEDVLDLIKEAIGLAGTNQKAISAEIEISEDSLSNYLTGKRRMPLDSFYQICVLTRCSPLWILFDIGDKRLPAQRTTDQRIADLATELLGLVTRGNGDTGDAAS